MTHVWWKRAAVVTPTIGRSLSLDSTRIANSTVPPLSATVGVLGRSWTNSVTPMTRFQNPRGGQVVWREPFMMDLVLFPLVTPSDWGSVGTINENEPFNEVRTLCTSVSLSSFRNCCRAIGPVTVRFESTPSRTLPRWRSFGQHDAGWCRIYRYSAGNDYHSLQVRLVPVLLI